MKTEEKNPITELHDEGDPADALETMTDADVLLCMYSGMHFAVSKLRGSYLFTHMHPTRIKLLVAMASCEDAGLCRSLGAARLKMQLYKHTAIALASCENVC